VTDAWLKRLSGVSTLRRLDLANCAVQGDGLRHIAALTGLRELNLTLTPVKDDALKHLGGLVELRVLGLASTQCNGTGFQHLKALKKAGKASTSISPLSTTMGCGYHPGSHLGAPVVCPYPVHRRGSRQPEKPDATETLWPWQHGQRQFRRSRGRTHETASRRPRLARQSGVAGRPGPRHENCTLRRLDVSHAPTVKDASMQSVAQMPAAGRIQARQRPGDRQRPPVAGRL